MTGIADTPLIAAVGQALYGSRWQTELARALGVSDRTGRRWAACTEQPRVGVYRDALTLACARQQSLEPLIPRLVAACAPLSPSEQAPPPAHSTAARGA